MRNPIHYYNSCRKRGFLASLGLAQSRARRRIALLKQLKGFPERLQIEISTVCNLDCEYCALRTNMPTKAIMRPELFERLVPYFKYVKSLSLSGLAEPLMNKHIVELIARIKKEARACHVTVLTNATLLDERLITSFLELGLDRFEFSVDGDVAGVVNEIRKGSDVGKILQNVRMLREKKERRGSRTPTIGAITVLQKKNYRQLPGLVDVVAELGVSDLLVNGMEPFFAPLVENVLWYPPFTPNDLADVLNDAIERAEKRGVRLELSNFIPTGPNCYDVNTPIILANGDVTACAFLAYERDCFFTIDREYQIHRQEGRSQRRIFGNIREQDLADIWFSPEYVAFRSSVLSGRFPSECSHCLVKYQFVCVRTERSPREVLAMLFARDGQGSGRSDR